jgi:hypothetical protein
MHEIISCPSCHRKLQVPESLLGQDVQCPTCGATFVGTVTGPLSAPGPAAQSQPAHPAPAHAPPPGGYDPYGPRYGRGPRRDLLPHRGSAVLTLGILSLVTCFVGIILGIIAWVMGQSDLQEMRAGRMDSDGEGMTNAGRICGIIGTCLWGGLLALYLFLIMVGLAASSRF